MSAAGSISRHFERRGFGAAQRGLEQHAGDGGVPVPAVAPGGGDDRGHVLGSDRARLATPPFGVVALHDAQRIGGHGAARVGPAGDPGEEGGGCGGLGDRGRR